MGAAIFYAVDAVALLRAVLAEHCPTNDVARQHLAACAARGIDPLDYCAHDLSMGNRETWARAARWAGIPLSLRFPGM